MAQWNLAACFILVLTFGTFAAADDFDSWVGKARGVAFQKMSHNISPPGTTKGCVVASPSTQNPDYFYHWVRDAAIVMETFVEEYNRTTDIGFKTSLKNQLLDYITFSKINQSTPTLSGGVGEPKFLVDGTAFMGDWGRPQDDGPALRALTLMRLASTWIQEGNIGLVRKHLYDGSKTSIVKMDLEYVSKNWKNTSFDLWEESHGHHFFTQMVQRKALIEGAKLADRMGDWGAANWYRSQLPGLEKEINRHWIESQGRIITVTDRDGGMDYKWSGLDTGTILGVLHGYADDGFFAPWDDKVLSTANQLQQHFQTLYTINLQGHRGTSIGRYPEDRYDGYSTHGAGNPWFVTTNAFAELYYRIYAYLQSGRMLEITKHNQGFFSKLGLRMPMGTQLAPRSALLEKVIGGVKGKGDDFTSVSQFHMDSDGSMSEQINRENGFMQGARDLTWSYASLLRAIYFR